ncbi:nucleotidyltransferase domain-containing protein [Yimella sp. cx-51]|uniref:nucleotidyltransferase domain-containing protein n=1 Tax=Yimella sp. cx-51 TaxID=2770551 RepID=UPI00165E04AE|nr:nucleotidyltransferase domain-containing protein [Yimella sp. cx-51]MBC9955645.1 DUF4111 domain-containing protein [Yimella sp. cx-51]MBD2759364.1 DUF4111 domain-containing protein [Yimella sp. cx-573]QTH37784.1 DUF4111 domain-containing protein [Yimella sp. cx-51]
MPHPVTDSVTAITADAIARIEARLPGYLEGMYLHGSLCWGEFFAGSDIDFVATTSRRPNPTDLAVLQQVHRELDTGGRAFDGFYLPTAQLAEDPSTLAVHPGVLNGHFEVGHHGDAHQATWHELAERGITMHGPDVRELEIFTSQEVLELNTRTNLEGYWLPRREKLRQGAAHGAPESVEWNVLGILRLHHVLLEHAITSKSGAGRWGRSVVAPEHGPIIDEALSWREQQRTTEQFAGDARRQEATASLMDAVLAAHDL